MDDKDIIEGDTDEFWASVESGQALLEFLHQRTSAIEALAKRGGGDDKAPQAPQALRTIDEEMTSRDG